MLHLNYNNNVNWRYLFKTEYVKAAPKIFIGLNSVTVVYLDFNWASIYSTFEMQIIIEVYQL